MIRIRTDTEGTTTDRIEYRVKLGCRKEYLRSVLAALASEYLLEGAGLYFVEDRIGVHGRVPVEAVLAL